MRPAVFISHTTFISLSCYFSVPIVPLFRFVSLVLRYLSLPSSSFLSLNPPTPPLSLLLNSDRLFISFCLAASPPTPLTRFALLFLHIRTAHKCVFAHALQHTHVLVFVEVYTVTSVCFCLRVYFPCVSYCVCNKSRVKAELCVHKGLFFCALEFS